MVVNVSIKKMESNDGISRNARNISGLLLMIGNEIGKWTSSQMVFFCFYYLTIQFQGTKMELKKNKSRTISKLSLHKYICSRLSQIFYRDGSQLNQNENACL